MNVNGEIANLSNPEAKTIQKLMPGEYLQQLRNTRKAERTQVEVNEQQLQAQTTQRNANTKNYIVPDVYYFDFDKQGLEKPWNENRDKNDEYFNYGM